MVKWIIGGCVLGFIAFIAISAKIKDLRLQKQRQAQWEEAQRQAAAKRAADDHGHGMMNESNPRCDRQRLSPFC